jgi:2'-hydroxyisoflavone reductase
MNNKPDFLKIAAMFASGMVPNTLTGTTDDAPPARKLRLLILGGTGFIGPWIAELAVSHGHHVTVFNRGRREKYVGATVGTEKLYGNRDPKLHALSKVVNGKEVEDESSPKGLVELEGRKWDAVIDNSGYVPRTVKASTDLLAPNVDQYLFVSTLSVYADNSKPGLDETDMLATLVDPTSENTRKDYGALKALCERTAERAMPGRVTIVRPGYIVGPRDTTDRFTYWPIRVSRGGERLVPGKPDDPVQFIDVRDLADFTIRCVENRIFGYFNATGPERKLSVSQLISACIAASKANEKSVNTSFTYAPYDWLAANGCPVGALPILLPSEGDTAGFHRRSIAKAVAAGMKYRSAEETCDALIKWWPKAVELRQKIAREENEARKPQGPKASQPAADQLLAGISVDTETNLLAAWRCRLASQTSSV